MRWRLPTEPWADSRPDARSGGPGVGPETAQCGARPALGTGEEALEELVGLPGSLDLGHVTAGVDRHLLGSREPACHVATERGRYEPVVAAPDEQRRRLERGQARIEAVAAQR